MLKKVTLFLGIFLILVTGWVSAEEVSYLEMDETGKVSYSSAEEEAVMLSSTLTPLATPTNLTWNVDINGEDFFGNTAWDAVPHCEGVYYLRAYRDGEEVFNSDISGLYDHDNDGRISISILVGDGVFDASGNYTFTVQALGDHTTYDNSEIATSEVYSFTCPTKKLETPEILNFRNGVLRHTSVEYASGYNYTIYDQRRNQVSGFVYESNIPLDSGSIVIEDFEQDLKDICNWNDNVKGFYITVNAVTFNIERFQNSEESDFSPLYSFDASNNKDDTSSPSGGGGAPIFVENILNDMNDGTITATEALDTLLQEMDNQEFTNLDMALNMETNDSLVNSISELEAKFCEENNTSVTVSNSAEDSDYLEERGIDVNDISVIGAALNRVEGNDVDINFSKADDTLSQDSLFYKNSVAVNIDIEGVADSKKLDIPIQITMPAPNRVIPDRMVILHYHSDGSIETIHPGLFYKDGIPYLNFVLTSFSPFVFCNEVPPFEYDSSSNQVIVTSEIGVPEGTLLVGAYQNGVLIDFEFVPATILENESTLVPLNTFDSTGADEIRYFVWNSVSDIKPLMKSESEKL